jgi:hypothetical protein
VFARRSNSDRQLRQQHPERQPRKSGRRERAAAQKTHDEGQVAGSIATNMTDIMSASAGRSSRLFKAATTSQSKISIALTASVILRSRSIAGEEGSRGGSGSSSLPGIPILNRRVNHKKTKKPSGTKIAQRAKGPSVSPQRFQRCRQNACLTYSRRHRSGPLAGRVFRRRET